MAVKCTVPYRGMTITGATFTVLSAYEKHLSSAHQDGPASWFVYEVEVKMPDGSVMAVPEWNNVKGDVGTGNPLQQAEAHMSARLTAAGATNIQNV